MAEELDDMGREAAAMTRAMLQLATMVAMRARERGQKEAEARARVLTARASQVKEAKLRELRAVKAMDPRNADLAKMISKNVKTIQAPGTAVVKKEAEKLALTKTVGAAKSLGLDKAAEKTVGLGQAVELSTTPGRVVGELTKEATKEAVAERAVKVLANDAPGRRAALQTGLEKAGLGKEVVKGRMLADMSQARPLAEALKAAPMLAISAVPVPPHMLVAKKSLELGLGRGLHP